jgi:RNA polymerase sigma-70 factor (ECF subfamily)
MPEDQELIEKIVCGSQAAMEVLTRKYYEPLRRNTTIFIENPS